ncbi:hypothetical protein [Bradyrhizobium sp. CCGUVB23]|uniref:hypothetical protein n=1 Tax=Bradyrhizobium sp. CCGUVB23 TaxID=2949630 RepID=UPI0020B26B29|nr:hypothetical protein [Bradyrhizobium sp. CCGUVB23]MCP3468027.1 hypothetical protein [Bradyrhizobium sp. CCGUVB23]
MTDSPPRKKQKHGSSGSSSVQPEPGPHDVDAALIARFANQAEGGFNRDYVLWMRRLARNFSEWLRKTERPPLAGRLSQLDDDLRAYAIRLRKPDRRLLNLTLDRLRAVSAGVRLPAGFNERSIARRNSAPQHQLFERDAQLSRAGRHPIKAMCAEDERLISGFRMARLPVQPATARNYASALCGFSIWLQAQKKRSIASRLYDNTLTQDAEHYKNHVLPAALGYLRELCRKQAQSSAGPGTQYMVVAPDVSTSYEPRHDAQVTPASAVLRPLSPAGRGEPSSAYGGSAAPGASSEAAASPVDFSLLDDFAFREGDHELIMSFLDDAAAESAPQPGASQVPPPFVGGIGDASPLWDQAIGRSSFAGTSEASSSFVARLSAADFGSIVGLSWEHGSQPAPPELIRALDARGLLPGPCRPTHLRILDRSYSAQWAGRGRREVATLNNLLGGDVMLIPESGFEYQGAVQVRPGTVPSSAVAASSTAGASSSGQGGSQALYGLPDIGEYVPQDFAHGDTRPIGAQDWGDTSGAESMGPSEMPTGFWGRHFEENIVSDPWQHTSTSGSDRHSAAAIGGPPAAHHQAPSQALAGASLPALSVGPLSDTLQAFLARFNAYVGQASGQGLNCLLETVLQLASNTERQDDETPQTQQLQQQAQLLRNSLVQDGTVDPHGEIDLYGAGVGVVLATSFGLRIQAIEAHANGGWTVHPVLGQEGRLVHILHTPGHFQPLWPRH